MKRCVKLFVALLAYYIGIDALFYRLNRHAKRIITFHNVLPDNLFENNLTNGVSDSVEMFREIVREIKKKYRFSSDIRDPETLTITFDDGFLNQYEVAGQILREEGNIPAVVFISGDVMDNTDPANAIVVEQLLHWTTYAPTGKYKLFNVEFELIDTNRIVAWVHYVRPAFVADSTNRGRAVLRELDSQHPMANVLSRLPEDYKRLRLTGISSAQVEELRARGWLVGWHTKSHFPLSSLNANEMADEIAPPVGFSDVAFSYPYGELLSVNGLAVRIAEQSGYPCAVSNVMFRSTLSGRYFLPRMSLPPQKYLLHFRLSGVEHFLKTFRLLETWS